MGTETMLSFTARWQTRSILVKKIIPLMGTETEHEMNAMDLIEYLLLKK